MIERLVRAAGDGGRVLPERVLLNVNYPIAAAGPRGTRLTRLGRQAFVTPRYVRSGEETYTILPDFGTAPEPVPGADTTALAQDWVSVTVLDGSWSASVPTVIARALDVVKPVGV